MSGNGHSSQLPLSTVGKYLKVLGIKTVALEAAVSELQRVADSQAAVSGFNSCVHPPMGKVLARKGDPGQVSHRGETVFPAPGAQKRRKEADAQSLCCALVPQPCCAGPVTQGTRRRSCSRCQAWEQCQNAAEE